MGRRGQRAGFADSTEPDGEDEIVMSPTKSKTANRREGSARNASARKKPRRISIELSSGKRMAVPPGTTARQVLEMGGVKSGHPVVAVRFRNKVAPLDRTLEYPGLLEPVHLGTADGMLIYRRSLTFVLIRAVEELFPDLRVYINHSLDQGYYAEVYCDEFNAHGPVSLSQNDVEDIERRMREIVERDEVIERREYPLQEAIELFRREGMTDKAELLKYASDGPVSIYRMGNHINHFYGQLAPSTGLLRVFQIVPESPGLILRFPRSSDPAQMPPRQKTDKMMGVLREYERWLRILNWRTVPQLNALIEADMVREYILIAEALHEKRLGAIADLITNHPRQPRIVLLSGPSASGKTTSTKRLCIQLRVNGRKPVPIELDNFFVDREKTPKDEKGEFDFESLYAVDIPRLQESVRGLLRGEEVHLPKFDFKQGRSVPGRRLRVGPEDIIVLEGIHALNDELLPNIPDGMKFKIYASPLTHLNIDDHNRISSSDARLLRRLVRDFSYRGYDAVDTLGRWGSVRRGEEKNIFPYQDNADVVFNSSLPYEISALKPSAVSVLSRVRRTEPQFSEAARLLKLLSYFREIPGDLVPRHSLLREFIGGSCFTY
jgi:uridine kinase